MIIPSETDFAAAFGVVPLEADHVEGYARYEFTGADGEALRLSFHAHERSVQTVWMSRGQAVCTVVHERATALRIVGGAIEVEFLATPDACRTTLEIRVLPELQVRWSSLVV